MNNKKIVGTARALAFQLMLETYLKLNNKKTIKEELNDTNFQYGVLTDEQLALLHFYLKDEFKALGLSLKDEIEKTGEEIVPGKLSKYEMNELIRRADQLVVTIDIVRQLVESKKA